MITPSQMAITLSSFPWPAGIEKVARADFDVEDGKSASFSCALFQRASSTPSNWCRGAGSPEGALRFALIRWLMVRGVDESEAHRLSLRISN